MGLNAVPISPASTVMLIRDVESGPGVEVFLLRRTLSAVFAPGLYVFPGGRVDDSDSSPAVEAISDGVTDTAVSTLLGLDGGGLAYGAAAIRECFEESGVLLARDVDGEVIRFDDPSRARRFESHRHALHAGSMTLVDLCRREGLRLCAGDLAYVSRWITPEGSPRRFDTRFFVARAPQGQRPEHDHSETIDSMWLMPGEAWERGRRGDLPMIEPTLESLAFLADHSCVDSVMAAAPRCGSG